MGKFYDMAECIGEEKIVDLCVSNAVMVNHSQSTESKL